MRGFYVKLTLYRVSVSECEIDNSALATYPVSRLRESHEISSHQINFHELNLHTDSLTNILDADFKMDIILYLIEHTSFYQGGLMA